MRILITLALLVCPSLAHAQYFAPSSDKPPPVVLSRSFSPSTVNLARFSPEREAELAKKGFQKAASYETTGMWVKMTEAGRRMAQRGAPQGATVLRGGT